jgi:kynurenine formamidase
MKYIDLSATIAPSPDNVPAYLRTEITYQSHGDGAAQARSILNVPPSVFRNDEGWATETITQLGTHDSTHVDAPWHYNSEIQGKRAATIDELPLEWFYGDGVVLDMAHKADGDAVSPTDARQELDRIGYHLKEPETIE